MSGGTRSSEPTLPEALALALEARLVDVHTAMFGFVTSYSASEQTCSVRPGLRRGVRGEDGERVVEELPIIQHVPVVALGGAGISITFPLAVGDRVLLIFSESSIDRGIDRAHDSGDDRRHDLNDAIAIPWASVAPRAGAMTLTAPDIRIGSKEAADPAVGQSALDAFKTIAGTVVDSAGAIAALVTALDGASWPESNVSAKVKIE